MLQNKETPYYLYKITNNVNGKLYIGITNNAKVRKRQHWNFERRFDGKTINILYQAMRKYGLENFSFDVICIGNKDYILGLEVKAISAYRTTEKKFGYNIKPGGESGRGYTVTDTPRDIPVFVSEFWFPNRRTAVKKLNITVAVYKNRQRSGTLGNVCRKIERNNIRCKVLNANKYKSCYVGGFWFPDLETAIEKLNRPESTLRARIRKGLVNAEPNKRIPHNKGKKSPIHDSNHPSAKPVYVEGVVYGCVKEATSATGYSKYIITSRIKEGHPDFKFIKEELNSG